MKPWLRELFEHPIRYGALTLFCGILFGLLFLWADFSRADTAANAAFQSPVLYAQTNTKSPQVYSGLEVFMAYHTAKYKGKRIGLVTNPTGVDRHLRATVDLFNANANLNLVALFAVEHGIRGNVRAGENVTGGRDPATGLPIYTLYGGKDHKPTPESLKKIDVMFFDIQDVGSRAYTYIWHMAECMAGCAAANVEFVVLDRPNIFGGMQVDGPVIERQYLSFIGLYPIPRVYGMTAGELARYLNTEERINCRLKVVPMLNYRRGMTFEETALPWVPTSPYIPSVASGMCFAATGALGEHGCAHIGIGYTLPFQLVGGTYINAPKMTADLNALGLPGVRFRPIYYKPFAGGYKDKDLSGVQIHVTDPRTFMPATTETAIMCYLTRHYPAYFKWNAVKTATFDKAVGTAQIRQDICAGKSYTVITTKWRSGIERFKKARAKYLLYRE